MKKFFFCNFIAQTSLIFIILGFLIVLTLVTLSDVVIPVILWFKNTFIEENISKSFFPPFGITLKILVFITSLYLIYTLYSILSTLCCYNFYKKLAYGFDFEEHNLDDLIFRGLKWNYYRICRIILPLVIVIVFFILIFSFSVLFFNVIVFLAGISIEFITFISTFMLTGMMFFSVIATVLCVWNEIITNFGISCIVIEPLLHNSRVFRRCRRLSFVLPSNFILYFLNFIFAFFLGIQFVIAVFYPEVFTTEGVPLLLIILIVDILIFFALEYIKTKQYIKSLLHQYNKSTINYDFWSNRIKYAKN